MVVEFTEVIDIPDMFISVFVAAVMDYTDVKWTKMIYIIDFIKHFVIAEDFQEEFEGRQGRVAIGVLKNSLFLA